MSIASWFVGFCSNVSVDKRDLIALRYRTLTKRLNSDFWANGSEVSNSWYVGSYGRNTGTNLISDIDFLFRLPWSVYNQFDAHSYNGQSALLQAVKNSVEKTGFVAQISLRRCLPLPLMASTYNHCLWNAKSGETI
ncbi:MAG: hypothetical protein ACI92Z_003519 [Paracoccaceae bacterium]|jgi:hypothetical protein